MRFLASLITLDRLQVYGKYKKRRHSSAVVGHELTQILFFHTILCKNNTRGNASPKNNLTISNSLVSNTEWPLYSFDVITET